VEYIRERIERSSASVVTRSSPNPVTPIDPARVRVILATDCGSTTTKAILIKSSTGYIGRRTAARRRPRSSAVCDVTVGVLNAITEVQELVGRRFHRRLRPDHPSGHRRRRLRIYISTSSAGGGLQMMVAASCAR
jgi:hypothetical protein